MWIRSQDKSTLVETRRIIILPIINNDGVKVGWRILAYHGGNDHNEDWDLLGVYPTIDRALQVLDEIQSHLDVLTLFERECQRNKPIYALETPKSFICQMPNK